MSRPARRIKGVVDSGYPPRYNVKPLGFDGRRSTAAAGGRESRTHHFVVNEIPKTATPNDVLRAMKELQVVGKDFPVSNITMPPPSFPRRGSVTKHVHVQMTDISQDEALHAISTIAGRPLFPETSTWAHAPRPASNLGLKADIPAFPSAFNAHQWVQGQLGSVYAVSGSGSGASGTGQGWTATSRIPPDRPSPEWCMDNRTRGRRVLIRGLPGMMPAWRCRKLGHDCGVETNVREEEGREDVKRLPPSNGSFSSTWVVTTDTVTNACRLVRKLNRQHYSRDQYGDRYIMRAEVIW